MKITKVECIPVSLPFAKPMIMSGDVVKWAHAVLLKLYTDEGVTGISESGDTSVWYMGESQESILHNICSIYGPKILLGEDPFNIETIIARMDMVATHNNHSKALVDYALHDLLGKVLGVPLYKLLGGRSNDKIRLAYVMSSGSPEEVAKQAQKIVNAGYAGIKLKVGANIVMPNITPGKYRNDYALYEDKPCVDEEPEECLNCLDVRIQLADGEIGYGQWGDSKHYKRRMAHV